MVFISVEISSCIFPVEWNPMYIFTNVEEAWDSKWHNGFVVKTRRKTIYFEIIECFYCILKRIMFWTKLNQMFISWPCFIEKFQKFWLSEDILFVHYFLPILYIQFLLASAIPLKTTFKPKIEQPRTERNEI